MVMLGITIDWSLPLLSLLPWLLVLLVLLTLESLIGTLLGICFCF